MPGDDPNSAQFASAHESHHKQLQDSTSYGALARVLAGLGRRPGLERLAAVAGHLTTASEHVQEAFASWLPARALGWSRDGLLGSYPVYGRYYDAIGEMVTRISSPYLQFHAAHAIARACMQTTAIETALSVGLVDFTLADLRHRDLPNSRFGSLRRTPPDLKRAEDELRHLAASDPRMRSVIAAPTLTAELFDPAISDVWQLANRTFYDHVAETLRLAGSPTLEHEGHLARTPRLLEAARRTVPDDPLDLEPGGPRRASEASALVLRNIESEGFTVAAPLEARVLPPDTDPTSLIADLADPHVFVTVRSTHALLANYRFESECAFPSAVGAFARRTIREPDGRLVVEVLDVTDAAAILLKSTPPVAIATPMSLLRTPALASWTTGPALGATVVLLDLPLGPHLDVWLTQPGARLRYSLLRTESFGRVVPFLVARVDVEEAGSSPILVRPLSHAGVRIHKATFDEIDPTGERIVEGLAFLHADHAFVSRCLAHLSGEEVRFGAMGL